MAEYTYLVTDLVSGQPLGEIPFTGVNLDVSMNGAGNFRAGGNLADSRVSDFDYLVRTQAGRTGLWAFRNVSDIVWGGILWSREYQSDGKSLSFTGQTFESYAARRRPRSFLGKSTITYTSQPQCTVINDLWSRMQGPVLDVNGAATGFTGNIGVLPAQGLPYPDDTNIQLTVNGWDLSKSVDDIIQGVLSTDYGPDYTIAWYVDDNGNPFAQLEIQPRLGALAGDSGLVVDFPGSVLHYVLTENASEGNTYWWAVGDQTSVDDGSTAITALAVGSQQLRSGWPLLEGVNSYQGVTRQDTIQGHANADLDAFPLPTSSAVITLYADAPPELGTYHLGDWCSAYIQDERFPSGAMIPVRVTGWSITPSDSQGGVEQVQLVLQGTVDIVLLQEGINQG